MGPVAYFNVLLVLAVFLIWIGIVMYLKLKKKKNVAYIVFFTIFYVYIVKVLDYTLFQFQSLLILKYFIPDLMLRGQTAEKSMNLMPLITLSSEDIKTSLLNIILLLPFGFGLPFITDFRLKKILPSGVVFSMVIELLQYLTGFLAKVTFRIADINDLIFNTIGIVIGYLLFVVFIRIYLYLFLHRLIPFNSILQHIAERFQTGK